MIIAVDGPAGAGKSTTAKILAKKLGFTYIDTGAMYRALTLKSINKKIDINDKAALIEMAADSKIDLIAKRNGALEVLLDGRDVSHKIRQPRITRLVSDLAKIKEIREKMVVLQRKLGHKRNSVLDGRDIGTVVFPNADKKFYLDADFAERSKRRFKELKELKLSGISLKSVSRDLRNRDTIDSTRKVAPLKKAKDAIYLDTTELSINQVVDRMLSFIR